MMNGITIKVIRLYNSQSQRSFAKELDFSSSGIAAVESGRYSASERLRAAIARKYPINEDFINFLREYEKLNGLLHDYTISQIQSNVKENAE